MKILYHPTIFNTLKCWGNRQMLDFLLLLLLLLLKKFHFKPSVPIFSTFKVRAAIMNEHFPC